MMTVAILGGGPGGYEAALVARQLGGDATLMAAIVTVETALALLTLPLALIWVV